MTDTNLYAPIIEKIEAAKAQLAELNIERTIAELVWDTRPDLNDDIVAWVQFNEDNRDALDAHEAYQVIDRLEETLATPLVKPTKRYVITDGDLMSPAGFALDSGVYIRNAKWLETNRSPHGMSLRSDVKAYDMNKVA